MGRITVGWRVIHRFGHDHSKRRCCMPATSPLSTTPTPTPAPAPGIYVIRMGDEVLVKQLQRLPGGILNVLSRNETYAPWSIRLDEFEQSRDIVIIGRVVWACRRL